MLNRLCPILNIATLVLALSLVAVSCGGSESDDAAGTADSAGSGESAAVAAADPTVEPEPTPEPTEAHTPEPEPTAEPTPEPAPEPTEAPTPQAQPASFDDVDAFAEELLVDTGLAGAGLIVVHRDEGVVHHRHYGEFDAERISLIASSSKMISAGVLFSLQDQGLIDLNAPIGDIAGAAAWVADHPDMTPIQLVSNSSGLVGLGPDLLYAPYICQWLPATSLSQCAETVLTTAGDDADVVAPDTEFRYGGAQWQVAGALAEAVSGKSWAELLAETYVEPCGTESLGYINLGSVFDSGNPGYPTKFGGDPDSVEPTENPNIEGGAYITTGDYGTLLLMQLQGGACPDGPVFSQESLDAMHGDRIGAAYDGRTVTGGGYGAGWWVDHDTGIISDGGAFGSDAWLNLDAGYGAYWVIEDDFSTTGAISEDLRALVHEAVTGEAL